jgi:hypothetical protein
VNIYKRTWDAGYGKRRRLILATSASHERKLCALNRVWARMVAMIRQ